MEEYGARIVKPIKRFVEKEGLEGILEGKQRPTSAKGYKTNNPCEQVIEIPDDDDDDADEFDDGIDYSAIDLG